MTLTIVHLQDLSTLVQVTLFNVRILQVPNFLALRDISVILQRKLTPLFLALMVSAVNTKVLMFAMGKILAALVPLKDVLGFNLNVFHSVSQELS
jgi:hypothetical protein